MSAPRFFVPRTEVVLESDADVPLPAHVARHATAVLRLRDGDAVTLFDGTGGEYPATLRIDGREAHARVARHLAVEREVAAAITLVQSLVASDVMDGIVRKAVELGAAVIQPVLAERSQRGPAERLDKRSVRWRQIAISACEQCGRNRVPAIEPIQPLEAWMAAQADLRFVGMLYPRASRSLAGVCAQVRTLLVGPEGGFTDAEASLAAAGGAMPVHLGARILRADTAAMTGLATINALAGDAR